MSNVDFDGRLVTAYEKGSPHPGMAWIDYGLGAFDAAILNEVGDEIPDLATLYAHLAATRQLFGFAATSRFYKIGTPEALAEAEIFLAGLE